MKKQIEISNSERNNFKTKNVWEKKRKTCDKSASE